MKIPVPALCAARLASGVATLALVSTAIWAGGTDWIQWGGPNRNFSVEGGPLATEWPEGGPRELWSREFGDGFSAILAEGDRLYSVHRDGDNDVVVALRADTGETIWATSYSSPAAPDMDLAFGPGPITTPAIDGDRLFAVSSTVKLHCLDKNSGKILWSRDLREDYAASHLGRGYGPSPIVYGDLVILGVGGEGHGVVAFSQETGETVWQSQDFRVGYSSPILIRIDGEDHLVVAMGNHRAGLDPATGELKWDLELPRTAGSIMSTQIWGPDHLLFGSSAYADGSRVIEVGKNAEGRFAAKELWYSRKMRVMYPTCVRIGDYVYGSSGDFGPAFLMAINVKTGEVAWRERGFNRTHFLHADGKVILLDEEGDLAIATVSPEGIRVHARAPIIGRTAWTPPTLAGTRLYVRNRSVMKAFDLGVSGEGEGR